MNKIEAEDELILQSIHMKYTNHQGKTSNRRVVPLDFFYGTTAWHSNEQWFMHAFDLDKQAERSFALIDCDFSGGEYVNE